MRWDKIARFFSEPHTLVLGLAGIIAIVLAALEPLHVITWSPEGQKDAILGLLGAILLLLTVTHVKVVESAHETQHFLRADAIERVKQMVLDIDPTLRSLLGAAIEERLANLDRSLSHHEARIGTPEAFLHFWTRTFRQFPEKSYCATSLARNTYFWKYEAAREAMKDLLKPRAGQAPAPDKMRRIFLVPAKDMGSEEARAIMEEQAAMGVQVRTIDIPEFEIPKLFLVDTENTIAWEVIVNGNGDFREAVVTTDKAHVNNYRERFEELWEVAKPFAASPQLPTPAPRVK